MSASRDQDAASKLGTIKNLFHDDPSSAEQRDETGRLKNVGENLVCQYCLKSYSLKDIASIGSPSSRRKARTYIDHIMTVHWTQLADPEFKDLSPEKLFQKFKPIHIKIAFANIL